MMLTANRKPERFTIHAAPARATFRPRILCATDLSSKSEQAIARALHLCERLDGRALLLHVVSDELPLRLAGRRADRARSALEWHARQYSHLGIKPELSVRVGRPYATIAHAARTWGADLVVLGLHRERQANELTWSTAERIALRVRRPVLVVNTSAQRDYDGVMFVADSDTGIGVQLADRFDLFSTAHVSVVPQLSIRERAALTLGRWTESLHPHLATRLDRFVHVNSQRAIEDAGLHLLGFELVSGRRTPRSLLSRIKRGKSPQLLVAGVRRNPLRLRSLARLSVLSALRTRACDVLVFPEAWAREILRAPSFSTAPLPSTCSY